MEEGERVSGMLKKVGRDLGSQAKDFFIFILQGRVSNVGFYIEDCCSLSIRSAWTYSM